jgi:DNA repair exonuclease SbcCD ATPase subunit
MIPLYLLLENFMSHARSELDFTQFDMALIIGMENDDPDSSNGIGKTALFDAIRWALYGKHRFRTKKRVIKRGKVACSVTFMFQIQNDTYKIVRKLSQRATSSEVVLLVQDGRDWRDLSCDTATATNEKIEDLIRLTDEVFVNSICFPQNDLLRFVAATASQKKEILKEGLEIGIWDRYHERAKEIVRRLSAQMSALDDRIRSFGDPGRDLASNKASMEILAERIAKAQTRIAADMQRLDELRERAAGGSAARLGAIVVRAAAIRDRKQAIVAELANYRSVSAAAQEDRSALVDRLLEAARQILVVSGHPERQKAEMVFRAFAPSRKLPTCSVFRDRLEQDRASLRTAQKKADDASMKLQQLLALEPGKKCPTCLTVLDDPDKVLRERKKRMKFLENTKREADTLTAELVKTVTRQESTVAKADAACAGMGHMEGSLSQLDAQLANLLAWCAGLENELRLLADEWKGLKEEKARLKGSENTGSDEDADSLQASIEELRCNLLKMSVEYGNLQGHAEDLERQLSERQTLLAQKPAIAKDLDIHNQLVKAFGKGGVPAIIMENVTEDLRNYANEILRLISDKPMSVDFVTQKRTESGSWTETFDISVTIEDEVNEFEDLSGGEQVRAAMAVRLALSNVLMRRMGGTAKFLLLDEVDQALDRRGVQALADTLGALSKEFKILVITHNEGMKERFDHIVTVQKGPDGSFLRQ